ncbi:MAG: hypothetical protein ABR968_14245, partial [Bacteroidales bacterium]
MNKSKLLPYFILIIILFATSFVKANTITTAGSGNWNSTAFNAPWPGGIVPASTDNVIIASGDNVAVTVAITQTGTVEIQSGGTLTATAANATVGPLTIDIGGTLTTSRILTVNGVTTISGTINFQTTARADAFNGDVTLISGATWSETVAITPSFSGNFSNNASTFTASTGVHTFSGSGKTFSGSTTTTIPRVTITGTYSNTGTLTVATALAGSGTLTNGAAGTLNIGCIAANLTITALDASTPNNTVNYNRAGVQTVFVTPYYNLTLSGSGAKTIGAVSVSNILDMTGTASASAAPTYGGSATLQYDQTATTGPEWISPFVATGGVIINSGTVTLGAAKVIGNNTSIPLKIVSSATLTPGANLLTFDGDFINAGTLTSGSGGVTITGTVTAQNIAGFTTTGTV